MDLKIQNVEGKLLVDSRDVAEMVGKQHWEILRMLEGTKDGKSKGFINTLNDNNFVVVDFFIKSEYQDNKGEVRPCYLLTKKGCDMVGNKLTGEKGVLFTATYVIKFEEMEEQLKSQVAIASYMIDDPIKRAEKWIEEQKEKQLLVEKVEEQKPLVTFAEKCIKTNDSILVRELAKVIQEQGVVNIGEKKLYAKLREWGLILQGKTEPSQRAMSMELFEVTQRPINTPYGERLEHTTKVSPKGQVYIIEKLHKEFEKSEKIK